MSSSTYWGLNFSPRLNRLFIFKRIQPPNVDDGGYVEEDDQLPENSLGFCVYNAGQKFC